MTAVKEVWLKSDGTICVFVEDERQVESIVWLLHVMNGLVVMGEGP
jgi:hypothetical protein